MVFLFFSLKLPNKEMEGIFQNNYFHSIPFHVIPYFQTVMIFYFRDGLDLANRDDKNSLFHPSILWGFLHPKKIIYMVIF